MTTVQIVFMVFKVQRLLTWLDCSICSFCEYEGYLFLHPLDIKWPNFNKEMQLALLLHLQNILGLNLSTDTSYPEVLYSFLSPSSKMLGAVSYQAITNSFQSFTVHYSWSSCHFLFNKTYKFGKASLNKQKKHITIILVHVQIVQGLMFGLNTGYPKLQSFQADAGIVLHNRSWQLLFLFFSIIVRNHCLIYYYTLYSLCSC